MHFPALNDQRTSTVSISNGTEYLSGWLAEPVGQGLLNIRYRPSKNSAFNFPFLCFLLPDHLLFSRIALFLFHAKHFVIGLGRPFLEVYKCYNYLASFSLALSLSNGKTPTRKPFKQLASEWRKSLERVAPIREGCVVGEVDVRFCRHPYINEMLL